MLLQNKCVRFVLRQNRTDALFKLVVEKNQTNFMYYFQFNLVQKHSLNSEIFKGIESSYTFSHEILPCKTNFWTTLKEHKFFMWKCPVQICNSSTSGSCRNNALLFFGNRKWLKLVDEDLLQHENRLVHHVIIFLSSKTSMWYLMSNSGSKGSLPNRCTSFIPPFLLMVLCACYSN